jgi:hypothetical protein
MINIVSNVVEWPVNEHLNSKLRGLIIMHCLIRFSKSLSEPSTITVEGIYNIQFQAKMRKFQLLKVRGS